MKLSYAIECVLVAAVGFGFARWHIQDPIYSSGYSQLTMALWLKEAGNGFFAGAGIAGLIGLLVEVALRRSPRSWGIGRWTWSVVGIFLLSRQVSGVFYAAILFWSRRSVTGFVEFLLPDIRVNFCAWLLDSIPYILIAIWTTALISGSKIDRWDGREVVGRIFAVLIVLVGIVLNSFSVGS